MSAIALSLVITAPSYAQAIGGEWHGVKVELPQIGGSYEGKIDAGVTSIKGTWSQSGNNLALAWKRQGGR